MQVEDTLTHDQLLRLECARIAGRDEFGRSDRNAQALYDFITGPGAVLTNAAGEPITTAAGEPIRVKVTAT